MEKNPFKKSPSKGSYSREFLPNDGLAALFDAVLGGIPRKEWPNRK
jgi:hypothetical protein